MLPEPLNGLTRITPVRVEQVTEIALGGGVLPQKSTDFYPKLLSGETIFRIEEHIDDPK
jgi:uncharacterized protein (DUF1015 family)